MEQLFLKQATWPFVSCDTVVTNTFIPETTGDGFNGKSLNKLCYVGDYGHLKMYMSRLVVDHRTFDDDHLYSEEERKKRHPTLELRTLSANALNGDKGRSEEHTSELPSLMHITYPVFGLKNTTKQNTT